MSIIGNLRRLGWSGLKNRLAIAWRDLPDWRRGLRRPQGQRLRLQPWRFSGLISRHVVAVFDPGVKASPALQVDVYGPPGVTHKEPPRRIGTMSARRLYSVADAVVLPRHVVLFGPSQRVANWSFFSRDRFRHPGLVEQNGDVWLSDPVDRAAAIRIDEPVFLADTTHFDYGHVLLEIVPRLKYLERCPPETRVLTSIKLTRNYAALFAAMGVDASRVVTVEGPVFCRQAYFGDSFVDIFRFVARSAWETFEQLRRLGEQSSVPTPERIYVSRRGVERRPLLNEEAIEQVFESHGFAIIRPETLRIEDQIRIFSHAKMIAGARGSGTHNVVFAAPDSRLLLLTPSNFVLAIDAYLMREDKTLAYALGQADVAQADTSRYFARWSIDPALVDRAIKAHFRL